MHLRQMKLFYLLPILLAMLLTSGELSEASTVPDSVFIARVYFDKPGVKSQCDSLGFRPAFEGLGAYCDYVIEKKHIPALVNSRLKYEIRSYGPLRPPTGTLTSTEIDSLYHTYAEMQNHLFSQAAAYPEIARVETIGTTQQEHRTMYAFKISDNVETDEDEPVVFFDGTHHACEVMGMEICLALIDTLLANYGTDSNITNLVNSTEIWLVPLVNPDGHSAVMNNISPYYRKNGRDLNDNGILYEYECNDWWTCATEGVDLNRNYDWFWDSGGQSSSWNYYYRGADAGSESENIAVAGLLWQIRPQLAISYHSYGEIVYYPWELLAQNAPDHAALYATAYALSSRIHKEGSQQIYDFTPSDGQAGMAANWQYGRLGTFAFTIETVSYYDFIIPSYRYHNVISENLKGCFYLLERAHGPQLTGRIFAPDSIQPVGAEIRILEAYSNAVDAHYSDSITGRYTWILQPGVYSLKVISDDYAPATINNISVHEASPTVLDVYLNMFLPGDANGSGGVTAADVTYLVRYFKGLGPAPVPLLAGDANGNCEVRPSDVTYLVVYLKGGLAPKRGDCP